MSSSQVVYPIHIGTIGVSYLSNTPSIIVTCAIFWIQWCISPVQTQLILYDEDTKIYNIGIYNFFVHCILY